MCCILPLWAISSVLLWWIQSVRQRASGLILCVWWTVYIVLMWTVLPKVNSQHKKDYYQPVERHSIQNSLQSKRFELTVNWHWIHGIPSFQNRIKPHCSWDSSQLANDNRIVCLSMPHDKLCFLCFEGWNAITHQSTINKIKSIKVATFLQNFLKESIQSIQDSWWSVVREVLYYEALWAAFIE